MKLEMNKLTLAGLAGGAGLSFIAFLGIKEIIVRKFKYDKEGYDAKGFDRFGYDREGYDFDGYDVDGYNRFGFDKTGYDQFGYDRDGYNHDGFDRNEYDRKGFDRAGCNQQDYRKRIPELKCRLKDAKNTMFRSEYRYALTDARQIFETLIKMIVFHQYGGDEKNIKVIDLIKISEEFNLINYDFARKLHEVRRICNLNIHEYRYDWEISQNQVYFVMKTIGELICFAETFLAV